MDWGSLTGLLLALAGIAFGSTMEGGNLSSLIQPAAFFIVVFGTMGAVLLQSGMRNFIRGIGMAKHVFFPSNDHFQEQTPVIIGWSIGARREGLLSLERHIDTVTDPFMVRGLNLIVDGIDPYKLQKILDIEISAYEVKERQAAKIWDAAGGYAPTIGILGAVLGLIHVMENLSDPGKLGSGIAVAFVATIYGVGFANLIFLPIGSKLKALINREVNKREMLADIFFSIATGENPRMIEERMAIFFQNS
jgi:chemotaxis protein MotA